MCSFLEGLVLFSNVYESQLSKAEQDEEDSRPRYTDYKEAVVAMMEDVTKIR